MKRYLGFCLGWLVLGISSFEFVMAQSPVVSIRWQSQEESFQHLHWAVQRFATTQYFSRLSLPQHPGLEKFYQSKGVLPADELVEVRETFLAEIYAKYNLFNLQSWLPIVQPKLDIFFERLQSLQANWGFEIV